jgi:hypothetical protein
MFLPSEGNGASDTEDSTMPVCIALRFRWRKWKASLYVTFYV